MGGGAEVPMVALKSQCTLLTGVVNRTAECAERVGPSRLAGPEHGGGEEAGVDGIPFHGGVGRHLLAECFVIIHPPKSILTLRLLDDN